MPEDETQCQCVYYLNQSKAVLELVEFPLNLVMEFTTIEIAWLNVHF